jgi:hypothetical protein
MNLKELTHKKGRLSWFTRAGGPTKRWPFRWLRKNKALTRWLHGKKGGVEGNEVTNVRQMQDNAESPEEHLCYIISQGFDVSDHTRYMTLTTAPKFRCGHCGRQAISHRNLCIPMRL